MTELLTEDELLLKISEKELLEANQAILDLANQADVFKHSAENFIEKYPWYLKLVSLEEFLSDDGYEKDYKTDEENFVHSLVDNNASVPFYAEEWTRRVKELKFHQRNLEKVNSVREQALSKLTPEERKALGY